MFEIMKEKDKISPQDFFSSRDSDMTRDHSLRVTKTKDKAVVRQGSFIRTVVNSWHGLPRKAMPA